jgi:hypothetical protein
MNKPHKHAELIKAWADGAEIEFRWGCLNDWTKLTTPRWDQDGDYRIKPEPKPDVVRYWEVSFFDCEIKGSGTKYQNSFDNLKLTFDGETGKLKAAEVLK